MYFTNKIYSHSSIVAKWSSFTPTPSYFALKVLNPYCESVAWLVQKNWMEYRQYFGREPIVINDPYTKQLVDWLFQNTDPWAIVFAQYILFNMYIKVFKVDLILYL